MIAQCWVAVPGSDLYRVQYDSDVNQKYSIGLDADVTHRVLYDGDTGAYLIPLEGLTSGGKMTGLSGESALVLLTEPSHVDVMTCLHGDGNDISLSTAQSTLEVVRRLAAEFALQVCVGGSISVERVLAGADEAIAISSLPCSLSTSVYAMLSDWANQTLGDLADNTLDALIYKEV